MTPRNLIEREFLIRRRLRKGNQLDQLILRQSRFIGPQKAVLAGNDTTTGMGCDVDLSLMFLCHIGVIGYMGKSL